MIQKIDDAVSLIRSRTKLQPRVGVVLGSGLGNVVDSIDVETEIPYGEIPGAKASTVVGHAGKLILGRPPSEVESEVALFKEHAIGWIVSKDSGGQAGAKIFAARQLALPVVLIERPPPPNGPIVETIDAAIAWMEQAMFTRA